ncbi:MAG: transcriptional repressor [Clostridia bacterium]|nr:transcriptional repressor [Clostridia bacterium]
MSKQRVVVYNAVLNSSDHPTADVVLARCKEQMPSINIATVYRNLNALIKEGVIQKVMVDGGDRFDKTLGAHAHFQCKVCNAVVDIDGVDLSCLNSSGFTNDNRVDEIDVTFKGVCHNCLNLN